MREGIYTYQQTNFYKVTLLYCIFICKVVKKSWNYDFFCENCTKHETKHENRDV